MTPYEKFILDRLRDLGASRAPVPSKLVACEINRPVRSTTYYLKRMQNAGLLCRPAGRNHGWAVA